MHIIMILFYIVNIILPVSYYARDRKPTAIWRMATFFNCK